MRRVLCLWLALAGLAGAQPYTTAGDRARPEHFGQLRVGRGSPSPFQVDPLGNITRMGGVPVTWPAANGVGALQNNGLGNLSWTPLDCSTLTALACLAGRLGGQTLYGGTSPADTLVLAPSPAATYTSGTVDSLWRLRVATAVGTTNTTINLIEAGTNGITIQAGGAITALKLAGTHTITGTPGGLGFSNTFNMAATFLNGSGGTLNATDVIVFAAGETLSINNNNVFNHKDLTASLSAHMGFLNDPTYNLTSGTGTGTVDSVNALTDFVTIGTGWTETVHRPIRLTRPGGSGTITDYVGIDIENLSAGSQRTTNAPVILRSQTANGEMRWAGPARVGANSAPITTLDDRGGFSTATVAKSANYTITASDFTILGTAGAGGITLTLPTAANTGQIVCAVKVDTGAGTITVSRAGADQITTTAGVAAANTDIIAGGAGTQYAKRCYQADGTSLWHAIVRL